MNVVDQNYFEQIAIDRKQQKNESDDCSSAIDQKIGWFI